MHNQAELSATEPVSSSSLPTVWFHVLCLAPLYFFFFFLTEFFVFPSGKLQCVEVGQRAWAVFPLDCLLQRVQIPPKFFSLLTGILVQFQSKRCLPWPGWSGPGIAGKCSPVDLENLLIYGANTVFDALFEVFHILTFFAFSEPKEWSTLYRPILFYFILFYFILFYFNLSF